MADLTFIHISDTHILKDYKGGPYEKLYASGGALPADNLKAMIAYCTARYEHLDFILITGDLVHEGDAEDYQYFKECLHGFEIPVYVCLGNHDNRESFWRGYGGKERNGSYYFAADIKGYRLIILDSTQGTKGHGVLEEEQLSWLKDLLARDSAKGSILALHHPPVQDFERGMLSPEYCLENAGDFYGAVRGGDLLGIFSGHVHRAGMLITEAGPLYTAASVAFGVELLDTCFSINNVLGFQYCIVKNNALYVEPRHFPNVEKELWRIPRPCYTAQGPEPKTNKEVNNGKSFTN